MSLPTHRFATSEPALELPGADRDQGWQAARADHEAALLAVYWLLIWRYRWRILTVVVVVATVAGLFSISRPREYQATAVIRVDPAGEQTLGSNTQSAVSFDALQLMTTEAQVITSPSVVTDLIRQANLASQPEFADAKLPPDSGPQPISQKTLTRVTDAISVNQPANTFLLQISFRARSPQLAADTANLLVTEFANHEYQSRADALRDSSQYMRGQMDTLKAQMEASQQALVQYQSANDVLDPDDKTNVMQARLSQLNEAYDKAQVARVQNQADYSIVQGGDLDALLQSDRGTSLEPLEKQLDSDQRQLTHLAQIYGPNYPLYRQQQRVLQADRQMLTDREQHIALQIADEYRAARSQEVLLYGLLQAQKSAMDDFNRKTIQYHNLKAKSDSITTLYYGLQQRIQDATVGAGLHSEELRQISPARPNERPVSPRPLLAVALAALFSLIVCAGAAVVVGVMDQRMNSEEEVERWLGIKVLGVLPLVATRSMSLLLPPTSGASLVQGEAKKGDTNGFQEAVLSLRSTLQFADAQRNLVLAICSSMPGEGKSTISANLARALAATGSSVVLVDCDLRKSSVHRQFGVSNRVGLANVLEGKIDLSAAMIASGTENLTLVPAGPSPVSAAQLLHINLGPVLQELRERFDHVLVDCPPVLGFADTQIIASLVNGVVLVVRAGLTERTHARNAVRHLLNGHANILGIVLNGVNDKQNSYYSYYGTHFYSGYHSNEEEEFE